jgi:hypothetical protein
MVVELPTYCQETKRGCDDRAKVRLSEYLDELVKL